MSGISVYIAPSSREGGEGMCMVVSATGVFSSYCESYRSSPSSWANIGMVDVDGNLACFTSDESIKNELMACAPLCAGMEFSSKSH